MQPIERRPPPPREREIAEPRHPTGRARRRWPVAYDGGGEPLPRVNVRYRRAYDGGERRHTRGPKLSRRSSALEKLRRNPIRHGLIGLTIAGAGFPVAIARHQTPDRVNPAHEQILGFTSGRKISDSAVARVWRDAQARGEGETPQGGGDAAPDQQRQAAIDRNIERYAEYDVPRDLAENIYDLALQANIDPDLAFGLVRAESAFKNSATSHVGAVGLTQLMPSTARWLKPGVTRDDLRDSRTNLDIGFRYLRQLIDKYEGNENLALLAYNRGPGTVDRVLKRGGDPNNGYVGMVKKYLERA